MSRPIAFDPHAARRREVNAVRSIRATLPETPRRRLPFAAHLIIALAGSAIAGYMFVDIVGMFI